MMRRAAVFAFALCLIAPAASAAPGGDQRQSYIVVLKSSAGDPGAVASEHSRSQGAQVRYIYRHALRGYAAQMSATAAARIANDRRVDYVEADGTVHAIETQANATWGLDRIDQRELPLSGTYTYTPTGAGVTAYIIDTGIHYSHVDFGGRASFGYDAFGGNGSDCNGHGTHVAGTVGGTTYGVAKAMTLKAVRVLNCNGSGTWSGVIAGIDWVTANSPKPAVANMSLGGGFSQAVNDAVERSTAAGVTHAVAAGNGNSGGKAQDACGYSPASAPSALTVGATTKSDSKTSWSNYGECVDLFAPGASITSAWHTSSTATNTISGTSMASPHVAGVAALYLQGKSGIDAAPSAVEAAIESSATTNVVTGAGTGSPNLLLYSLLTAAESSPSDTTPPVISSIGESNITETDATISWTTDETATSRVEYGTDSSMGSSVSSPDLVTGHSLSLSSLTAGTTYHYRVISTDGSGNTATSSERTFTTLSANEPPPPSAELSVTLTQGSTWTTGPWYRTNLTVAVKDGTNPVPGAAVTLNIYSVDTCSGAASSGSGTTATDGTVTFEFRDRSKQTYWARAIASSSGVDGTSACTSFSL